MMKRHIAAVLLWGSLALGQAPHSQGRIVTTTRLVAVFSELENQLVRALQSKDQSALNRLLGDDFQVWKPMSDPIPREDWIQQAEPEKTANFRIENMAVRSLKDDTSVASFVLTRTSEKNKKSVTQRYFIIDCWQKTAQGWQATDRYVSEFTSATGPAAAQDIRPTGKN